MSNPPEQWMTTAALGRSAGYSAQQVRDLERLGVLPRAERAANGYRRYGARHAIALRAYRALAAAIGPVAARSLMPQLVHGTVAEAAARIDDLHAELAVERARVHEALRALRVAVAESVEPFASGDAMTIGELAQALGIRSSALRHWEGEGLIHPLREGAAAVRIYGATAITEARIVAALRGGGHGIPATARLLEQLRRNRDATDLGRLLSERQQALTRRSVSLLAAAGELHDLLAHPDARSHTAGVHETRLGS